MKKFLNNRLSTQPQYQRKCIQHLQHDFIVQQYLQQTTSIDSNHKSYINLLNHITFNNKSKKRHIKHLTHQIQLFTSKNQQQAPKISQSRNINRWSEMLDFQKKIIQQQQIKNHLLAEMNEVSKSINLMRGDVTRIIEKNESTNILQKKTNKVKLIAQDQLKKVNLALHKDHDEILQRNNMQIRFNKKLKNICNSENNFLNKIKLQYLRLQKRKNLTNDKIQKMRQIIKNLSQRQRTRQQINIINDKNKINLQQIIKLDDIINKIKQQQNYKQQYEQINQNIIDNYLILKTQKFKIKIKQIQINIINYIQNINNSIEISNKQFHNLSQKITQYKYKLQTIEQQYQHYSYLNINIHNMINPTQKYEYDKKLIQFKKLINILLIIWQFIQNNHNFTILIDQINNQSIYSRKQQNIQSRFYRKSQQFQKNTSVIKQQHNFTNKLYNLISFLTGNTEQTNIQSQFIIKSLEMTIIIWLKGFKNLILSQIKIGHLNRLSKMKSLQNVKYKSTFELIDQNNLANSNNKYRLSLQQGQQDKLKTMLELISPKKSLGLLIQQDKSQISQTYQLHKYRRTQGNQQFKAKRIKILQKVDYDYYKMLKNVLQIQKQNIKKNYDFNKTFNRSKFTQKNILQQQKRYQSNFALEFIKKNQQSMIIQSHRSIISKVSQKQKPFKRRQFHHKTQLMNNFRLQSASSIRKNSNKSKSKQVFFNAHKLQRKSKLIQKQNQEFTIKQNRISVNFQRPPTINFAEMTIKQQY